MCPRCGAVLLARPRTTGYRSQSNRFRGHCDDIAGQIKDGVDGVQSYSSHEIAEALKRMAVYQGWPTKLSPDGIEVPISEAEASVEEEQILLMVQQQFADAHDLWLIEYDDSVAPPIPYKSVAGRTRKEMEALKHGNE